MTKEVFDKFLSALKASNINQYVIRCEGANRVMYHGTDSSIIVPKDDYVVCIHTTDNYATSDGVFNIEVVPYENIDDIKTIDVTFKDSIDLIKALDSYTKDVENFVKHIPRRVGIVPGTAALDSIKKIDPDTGKEIPTLAPGSSGYVTQ